MMHPNDEDHAVADTVEQSVKEGRDRLVGKCESLDAAHDDAVRDDKSDVDGELRIDLVGICFQYLVNQDHQHRDYYELDDDADPVGNRVPEQGEHQA